MKTKLIAAALLAVPVMVSAATTSVYPTMPKDVRAVTVKGVGDGRTDETAAIQAAIDAATDQGKGGVVFLPSGRYRVSRSIIIPPAVRIFGVGKTRPVVVLGDNSPGFDKGVATLFTFTGSDQYGNKKPPFPPATAVPFNPNLFDANSGTFYSAMANVDVEIGAGNAGAVVARFHVAQHTFLSHMDFRLGSGLAGVYLAGNVMEDVHFHGGRYGIISEKTSPAWQFTLIDSSFDGQREAAIREHEVDLTLVNVAIRDVPVGIDIDEGYSDSLWGKDVSFTNVSKAAVVISAEKSLFTQIGFENATASNVPTFARFRESGKTLTGAGARYRVKAFNYGLTLDALNAPGTIRTNWQTEPLRAMPAAYRAVRPLPLSTAWANVQDLGAKGDGQTDDTAALQKAIDTHRILYFPQGYYQVSDTLKLKPDTVLVGLHPSRTQIMLPENVPAFAGLNTPKALIESAKGGDAIVSGIGLYTGVTNPRATALLWKAGPNSLVDDVKIQGGSGTPRDQRSGAPVGRVDGQYPSIWITDGGGGTFADIWTPDEIAHAGFKVSNTKTPGHVYELSNEHHFRNEIVLDGVENWEFLAPQTEEEVRDSADAISLDVRNSRNILFANYHAYRVTRNVHPNATAVRLQNSSDIRFRNLHTNAESGYAMCDENGCAPYLRASKFPFENAITDVTRNVQVREREFAVLDVTDRMPVATPPAPLPGSGAIEKLADGFHSISGAAVAPDGTLYFVERRFQRIYRWTPEKRLEIVRDDTLDPVNLAIDKSGNVLAMSPQGDEITVYSFNPNDPAGAISLIPPTPAKAHDNVTVALPGNVWKNDAEFKDQLDHNTYRYSTLAEQFAQGMGTPKAREYVSPDGSLVLPAFRTFRQGDWRFSDTMDALGLVTAKQGERVFLTNESEGRTYNGLVGPGGTVTDLKVFAERGGESVAVGPDGKVFVANGQVFVYAPDGRELTRIDVPERPIQLVFGGKDKRTLYILCHHALYAVAI
ncbi:MAG TPA: glycosyl hydrolase family 28-related protein [Sphingomonas sp.]|uniref:glycosyl hydrolase family 28-related protein n=1 Tax=Sphingomonas sp. TaxID=28214 RepID=UPI002B73AA91|nr:glycosyl hydrolase family 28-related protein [Sphingomonas sp.]HMI20511.1 glycosyl hydrolase family 28-related protein [Sphingomonas sp.]